MKKATMVSLIAIMTALSSCASYEAKEVTLTNMNDSLNYTLGLSNGAGIKQYYMANDSTGKSVKAFVEALNKAYNVKEEKAESELFSLGKRIGASFASQRKDGLIGEKELEFKEELVIQGFINAINKFEAGMQGSEARDYFQSTVQEIRNAKN